MEEPTPEEIAKVDAWHRHQAQHRAEAAAIRIYNERPEEMTLTWRGVPIDDTWPAAALLGVLIDSHRQPAPAES